MVLPEFEYWLRELEGRRKRDQMLGTIFHGDYRRPEDVVVHERLAFEGTPAAPGGTFEILAITAGLGNGWTFPAAVLQASLPLWNKVECFLDHDYRPPRGDAAPGGRSVRDLAGMIHSPAWDDALQGIKATLKAVGPAGQVLTELGRDTLQSADPTPNVGFSADVYFTANKNKEVQKILKVFSVDLVIDPARGGQFIRTLFQNFYIPLRESEVGQENRTMEEPVTTQAATNTAAAPNPIQAQLEADQIAVRNMLGEHQRQQALQASLEAEATQARTVRTQMCSYLLDAALTNARLPQPVTDRIRSQFQNTIFEPAALQTAIDDYRTMVSQLTANSVVQGPGRIGAMYDSRDKLQAATDDLLGAPRDPALQAAKVQRLSGIRELYLTLTGDYDLHGGFYADRTQLATTADFTGLVKNALNKIVVNTWEQLGKAGYNWWQEIVVTEHFNTLNAITGTLVGTVGDLPTVAEGAEYTELAIGDSPETASFTKYGGYIPLTLELIDRDETRKLSAYAREMASAGLRKVSKLVAALFTTASATGPLMADTGRLFNAVATTTKGGHKNLLTTALSQAEWDIVSAAIYNQAMLTKLDTGFYGVGPSMAISPKYMLVPRALQLAARQICYGEYVGAANTLVDNVYKGLAVPLTVPEWTDATDWAAVCDPAIAPAIYVGERFGLLPEVYVAGDELSPAVFTNDEHRLKVRHFLAVWVNDYRPLHKSNVGG